MNWILSQLADVPYDKIPANTPPPWWAQAAVIMIVGSLAACAFAAMWIINKDTRNSISKFWGYIEGKDQQLTTAHETFSKNLETIAAPFHEVVKSVDGLRTTVDEHGRKIDRLHRKITKGADDDGSNG